MITIDKFALNPFQMNTYVLSDETHECVIVDPGSYEPQEEELLTRFLQAGNLKPVRMVFTHCHVDHILGTNFIANTYKLKPEIHKAGLPFYENGHEHAKTYGFKMEKLVEHGPFIDEGDLIKFGNSEVKVIYTPGHADGSICFVGDKDKFVVTGDVLFKDSIGRTDFPTGDFDLLMKSIHEKIFTLPMIIPFIPAMAPKQGLATKK